MEALLQAGEAVLAEVDAAFAEDPLIEEIGVVFASEDAPRHGFLLQEHRLGVPSHALKSLYAFAQQKLRRLQLQFDAATIAQILSATRGMLLVKGDVTHAWHLRKRIIEERGQQDDELQSELLFTRALLTRHPKAPPAWEHRRWCHQRAMAGKMTLSIDCSAEALAAELQLCAYLAELHPKNYFAWSHRQWVLKLMNAEELEKELSWTHDWIKTHVSDHSAVNHIEQTLLALATGYTRSHANTQPSASILGCILRQIDYANAAVEARPGHETLWYHKRKLFMIALQHLTSQEPMIWSADACSSLECTREIDELCTAVHVMLSDCAQTEKYSSVAKETGTRDEPLTVVQLQTLAERSDQLALLLYALARSEIAVACKAVGNTGAWEYSQQRSAALRFGIFVLHNMLRYWVRCQRIPPSEAQQHLAILLPDISLRCDGQAMAIDHPFALRLAQCAQKISRRLITEDELPRCWLYLQFQYDKMLNGRTMLPNDVVCV